MDIVKFFVEQLDREVAISRRVLTEVPEGRNDWKPHEKSMAFGYLAALVAQMPAWIAMMIETDGLDLDKPETHTGFRAQASESTALLLKLAEDSAVKAEAALQGTNEEFLQGSWSFRMGGRVVSGGPRHQQIADTFAHLAHHRGQLTVYLRLNGAKVPSLYGPSADERSV